MEDPLQIERAENGPKNSLGDVETSSSLVDNQSSEMPSNFNPLDQSFNKVGIDIDSLRAYDDFNWDIVAGIDDIARSINTTSGKIAASLDKRVDAVFNRVDDIDGRITTDIVRRLNPIEQDADTLQATIARNITDRIEPISNKYIGDDISPATYIVYRPSANVGFIPVVEELRGPPIGTEYYGPFSPQEAFRIVQNANLPIRSLATTNAGPSSDVVGILDAFTRSNVTSGDSPNDICQTIPSNSDVTGGNCGLVSIDNPPLQAPIGRTPPSSNIDLPMPISNPSPPNASPPTSIPITPNRPIVLTPDGCNYTIRIEMPEIKVEPCKPDTTNIDYNLISTIVTTIVNNVLNNVNNTTNIVSNTNVDNSSKIDNSQTVIDDRDTTTNTYNQSFTTIDNRDYSVTNIANYLDQIVTPKPAPPQPTQPPATRPPSTPTPSSSDCLKDKGDVYFGITVCAEAAWNEFNDTHNMPDVDLAPNQRVGDVLQLIRNMYDRKVGG